MKISVLLLLTIICASVLSLELDNTHKNRMLVYRFSKKTFLRECRRQAYKVGYRQCRRVARACMDNKSCTSNDYYNLEAEMCKEFGESGFQPMTGTLKRDLFYSCERYEKWLANDCKF